MEGLKQIAHAWQVLHTAAYEPWGNQEERESYAVHPGKRGGSGRSEIGVKDGYAEHLLGRLDRELNYIAERTLREYEGRR